jgi:outer membrane protein assembly factor BamE (lipoprotein component of BamABCDE complex)
MSQARKCFGASGLCFYLTVGQGLKNACPFLFGTGERRLMRYIALILTCVIMISGCGVSRGITATSSRNKLNQIEIGMSKDQVSKIMGAPYKREAYSGVEYWLYITEWDGTGILAPASSPVDSELTPIAFVDGKVDGWGRNYYIKQKERIEADIRVNK